MAKIHLSKVDAHIDRQLVFKAGDIEKLVGNRSHVKFLVKEKRIVSLGSGYYSTPRLERLESLILILQKYFPQAIISGASALYIHGIIKKSDFKIEADIVNTTSQRSHLFTFSRVAISRLVSYEEKEIHEKRLRVYTPERALADLILKKANPQLIRSALIGYLDYPHKNHSRIEEMDCLFGTDLRKRLSALIVKNAYSASQSLSEKQVLLEVALSLYSQSGSANISIRSIALESSSSIKKVSSYFKSKNDIIIAIFDAVNKRIIRSAAEITIEKSLRKRAWVEATIHNFLKIVDEDPVTFRILRWCITEENPHRLILMKLWNEVVTGIAEVIHKEVPGLDKSKAQARSMLFVSLIHQYGTLRWYFMDHLNLNEHKDETAQNLKYGLLQQIDNILYKPVI